MDFDEFLGVTYLKPPMPKGYAWLPTLATVPLTTLVLVFIGGYYGTQDMVSACASRFRTQLSDKPRSNAASDFLPSTQPLREIKFRGPESDQLSGCTQHGAEVFGLNPLFVALAFYLWLDIERTHCHQRVCALLFTCGLAMCNHQTFVFVGAPLVLHSLWVERRCGG